MSALHLNHNLKLKKFVSVIMWSPFRINIAQLFHCHSQKTFGIHQLDYLRHLLPFAWTNRCLSSTVWISHIDPWSVENSVNDHTVSLVQGWKLKFRLKMCHPIIIAKQIEPRHWQFWNSIRRLHGLDWTYQCKQWNTIHQMILRVVLARNLKNHHFWHILMNN